MNYGLVQRDGKTNADGVGIGGRVGEPRPNDYAAHVTFSVEVPDVEGTRQAQSLGGSRVRRRSWTACSPTPRAT
jgi:hypothetical protein